jgi:phytoene dehydrogenase-like protein
MPTAVVVGAGPNGLACAVALAHAGVRVTVLEASDTIGGGTRTSELTVPGLLHDHCSAVHPMAVGSPFLRKLKLERHGLAWCFPEVDLAHPLDDGSAGTMLHSVEATAEALGRDGKAWTRAFARSAANMDALNEDTFRPLLHIPRHPIALTRFGIPAALPATLFAKRFRTPQGKALFGGVAAHAYSPLGRPLSSSIGAALIAACHAYGWPVARGGSRAITDALAAELAAHDGTIETGVRVRDLGELPEADAIVLDLAPRGIAEIAGDRLPRRVARAYRRYKHGPGAFKVDLAVRGGVPWANEACRKAGTVHAVGGFDEIVAAEAQINRGEMPERPLVLVGQQYLADPTRSSDDLHPVWTYAHVPSGYDGDATGAVLDQLERFAPGVRQRVVATATRSPAEFEAYNPNYVGGDIITGANTPWQFVARPRLALDPYETGIRGVFVCSAATPPGAGAHGMNGHNAAQSALAHIRRHGKAGRGAGAAASEKEPAVAGW